MKKHNLNLDQLENEERDDLGIWRENKEFLEKFAFSLKIFDPLDREIKGDQTEN